MHKGLDAPLPSHEQKLISPSLMFGSILLVLLYYYLTVNSIRHPSWRERTPTNQRFSFRTLLTDWQAQQAVIRFRRRRVHRSVAEVRECNTRQLLAELFYVRQADSAAVVHGGDGKVSLVVLHEFEIMSGYSNKSRAIIIYLMFQL